MGAWSAGGNRIVRGGVLNRRDTAGISSKREARNLPVESLRFPGEGSSAQGKSGPKSRPKGVDDGQQVEIPVPPTGEINEAVTQKDSLSARMEKCVQGEAPAGSEVPLSQGVALTGSGQEKRSR